MNASRLQNLMLSLGLLGGIIALVLMTLVYHVSAVVLAGQRERDRWIPIVEQNFGYTQCEVLSDSRRVIRIISLHCFKGTRRYVHIADGGTLLGESEVSAFDFDDLQRWVKVHYGEHVNTSVSFYNGSTVLLITDVSFEVLVDPITLMELWKVDFNYE